MISLCPKEEVEGTIFEAGVLFLKLPGLNCKFSFENWTVCIEFLCMHVCWDAQPNSDSWSPSLSLSSTMITGVHHHNPQVSGILL